jgi:hypothetical protein
MLISVLKYDANFTPGPSMTVNKLPLKWLYSLQLFLFHLFTFISETLMPVLGG